ncbi:hypothetical protein SAMD00019534_079070 [Acytostelium subglobosum LB1]|uniref:hypothetical protein n=1 Tax=Acytostelium subglobosum LB1 TaxID=1410327 RepID=UPI000644C49B|nr:hypothetical protein SAMD00019534_079070 [Acytostelium subglobosum LB1]GAM24732.1 hypothetical protein SAMD00019534_079070 [Acytostelium subglobosum LB1]|eukprot:XP_012752401.1 hypothetical protein SAMD00019534_079070 [Acytostelium subglobosum LB1]
MLGDLANKLFNIPPKYVDDKEYCPPKYEVPVDNEGYLASFSIDQIHEYRQFFNDYGFVIIRDVLDLESCQSTIDDIWRYIENDEWLYYPPMSKDLCNRTKRNDPSTWKHWPSMAYAGIVGGPSVFTKQSVDNRANNNIYQVYSQLLDRKDLFINHDRYGFFRPTINILESFPRMSPQHTEINFALNDNQPTIPDMRVWKTELNLHLDMNPFAYIEETNDATRQRVIDQLEYDNTKSADFIIENNEVGIKSLNELHIQGLINLADNKDEDGGFIVVPGFPRHLEEWTLKNKTLRTNIGTKERFVLIPVSNSLYNNAVRVTARAGSLVLWNQKMAHGSVANNSPRPRLAQFIKMTPCSYLTRDKMELRTNRINQCLDSITGLDKQSYNLYTLLNNGLNNNNVDDGIKPTFLLVGCTVDNNNTTLVITALKTDNDNSNNNRHLISSTLPAGDVGVIGAVRLVDSLDDASTITAATLNEMVAVAKLFQPTKISVVALASLDTEKQQLNIRFYNASSRQALDSSTVQEIGTQSMINKLKQSFTMVRVVAPRIDNTSAQLLKTDNQHRADSVYLHHKQDNVVFTSSTSGDQASESSWRKLQESTTTATKKTTPLLDNIIQLHLMFKISNNVADITKLMAPCLTISSSATSQQQEVYEVSALALIRSDATLTQSLKTMIQAVVSQLDAPNQRPLHYQLPIIPLPITCLFGLDKQGAVNDDLSKKTRESYHHLLFLPMNRPLLRSFAAKTFDGSKQSASTGTWTPHIKDIHKQLSLDSTIGGTVSLVKGSYDYYHYKQDHTNDDGWGCAYRSMQTICSWLKYQDVTQKGVPTHHEIQKILVDMKDKKASFYKSAQWIGAFEITLCLQQLYNIDCKIINVTSGAEVIFKTRELARHFDRDGSPVMIGGGVLAYTLLGVDFNPETGDSRYLILDPHYTGDATDVKTIKEKGWCGWKSADLFRKDAFYNFCLPQVPDEI